MHTTGHSEYSTHRPSPLFAKSTATQPVAVSHSLLQPASLKPVDKKLNWTYPGLFLQDVCTTGANQAVHVVGEAVVGDAVVGGDVQELAQQQIQDTVSLLKRTPHESPIECVLNVVTVPSPSLQQSFG